MNDYENHNDSNYHLQRSCKLSEYLFNNYYTHRIALACVITRVNKMCYIGSKGR